MAPVAASTTGVAAQSCPSMAAASSSSSSAPVALYIVNPNSSTVITAALSANLTPFTPPSCTATFVTGPASSPETIQDSAEMIVSTAETYKALVASSPHGDLALHPASAFLVACFSDHPLVRILREKAPTKPAMHLLEAAVLHALSAGERFGILTTGQSMVADLDAGVTRILGGNSRRFVGTHATNLGVVELQSGSRDKVHERITRGAQRLAEQGADVIILGCAGMTGFEPVVRQACHDAGVPNVKVVDGAKAGMHILAGLARVNYTQ